MLWYYTVVIKGGKQSVSGTNSSYFENLFTDEDFLNTHHSSWTYSCISEIQLNL